MDETTQPRGISVRAFVGIVGAVLLIIGLWGLTTQVTVPAVHSPSIVCGNGWHENADPGAVDTMTSALEGRTYPGGFAAAQAECDHAIAARRAWTLPLTLAGALIILGAATVRRRGTSDQHGAGQQQRGYQPQG
jgi:hypothetical protein